MKKTAITGGKGGTGKSTVAVLLANEYVKKSKKPRTRTSSVRGRVILVDCDVECPNDYLLVGEKLEKPVKKVYGEFPELDKKKCKKCGLCVKTCRENAIFQAPEKYPVFIQDLCSGCGACWLVCPHKAIKSKKEKIGEIYFNKVQSLWLITGMAKPAMEETGPVVFKTKEFALKFAKQKGVDFILFDTAAGTHCSVISALLDCDLAYAVTEPTPMGAYDLGLILDLCEKLKVPAEIILNQADLGDKRKILPVAKKFKTQISKQIPYSRELVKAYSKGRLLDFNF